MKKDKVVKLALLGLANGLLVSAAVSAKEQQGSEQTSLNSLKQNVQVLASKCGAGKCSVASKCGAGKCSVASKCGAGKCSVAARDPSKKTPLQDPQSDPNNENLGYHLMTEDELLLELNDNGVKLYKSLSPEGKTLALQVASQRCNGTNSCAGLNACETPSNSCAGKGSCKGTSKCAVADKNLAVKLVADKMAKKRSDLLQK